MTTIRNMIHALAGCATCATALALAACTVTTGSADGGTNDNGSSSSGGGSSGAGSSGASSGGSSSGGGGDDSGAPGDDASDAGAVADASIPTDANSGPPPHPGPALWDGGCVSAIEGQYVVRTDATAVFEGTTEHEIIDNTSGTMNTPLSSVVEISQNNLAACALRGDGSVWCWQEDANNGNTSGQLGIGTTNPPVPIYRAVQVLAAAGTPLGGIIHLATGVQANATCAIKSDHTLWCWGDLGWLANNGTALIASYAQQVKGPDGQAPLSGVIQASISYANGCALVSGSPNSVYCWGYNLSKQLGQGDTTARQYPTKVPGLTNPLKVVVAYLNYYNTLDTVCELDGDQVLCFGSNQYGAAGDPGSNPVPSATAVVTSTNAVLTGITDIEEGNGGFGAIKNDGTLWFWGNPNGNNAYASSNGAGNVVALGWASDPRYATTGGYFNGKTMVNVSCGALSQ